MKPLVPLLLFAATLLPASAPPPLQDAALRPEPDARTPLHVNPPTFRWPAEKGARKFEIELGRSADFKGASRSQVGDVFWRPLKSLAPGEWHWRVRPSSGAWLTAASFRIPADLPRWDVEDWKTLAGRVPKGRPRILLRPEDVAMYQARAAGPLRQGVREWVRHSEEWLGKSVKGKQLEDAKESGDAKEDALRTGKVKTWQAKGDSRQLMAPVEEMSWLWMLTGEDRWANEVRRRVLLAAAMDPERELNDRTSDFANATIVAGTATAYDMLHDRFTPGERFAIRQMLAARAAPIFRKLGNAPNRPFNAHNWQRVFLDGIAGALALDGEEPVARQWLELAVKTFVAFYPWFGGADGGSAEGVNYYTCCGMLSSLGVRDLFLPAFGIDFARDNPWYRGNPYYLIYAVPPGGIRSPFGDVNPGLLLEPPLATHRLAGLRMASLYRNGHAADYARRMKQGNSGHWLEWFLWSGGEPAKPEPLESLAPARAFRDIGMVFLHSALARPEEDVRVEFRSSPYGSQGHAHYDQNSFVVIAHNQPLLLDTGYYTSAGDRHHANWTRQSRAHNTILVDSAGQSGDRGPQAYGEIAHFEQNRDWVYTVGGAAAAYPGLERFDRHLLWLRGGPVEAYVIVDDLAASDGKPHRFDWLLHAAREMRLEPAAGRVQVAGGKAEARVEFVEPRGLSMRQTDRFDPPPENWRPDRQNDLPAQWHLSVSAPAAPSLKFVAVLQVGSPGFAALPVERLENGVRVGEWKIELAGNRLAVRR